MTTLAWLVPLLVLGLLGLHRLAIWMEGRGWIYYRHRGSAAAGSALLEIQSFYRPSVEHVIELRQDAAIRAEEDDEGDPPEAGRGAERPITQQDSTR